MKKLIAALVGAALIVSLAGCTNAETEAYQQRQEQQATYVSTDSLEKENLQEKREREDDATAIRYLYLMSFGQIIGYYVTQGKISSNGSQMGPESEVVQPCTSCDRYVVDSAQDDGSYGDGDPGIFFFTTDGTMVVTSLDYIQSDQPLAIDVPRLDQ